MSFRTDIFDHVVDLLRDQTSAGPRIYDSIHISQPSAYPVVTVALPIESLRDENASTVRYVPRQLKLRLSAWVDGDPQSLRANVEQLKQELEDLMASDQTLSGHVRRCRWAQAEVKYEPGPPMVGVIDITYLIDIDTHALVSGLDDLGLEPGLPIAAHLNDEVLT